MITEELLHYIWRTKNFNHNDLRTDSGSFLSILSYGNLNFSDGPDFLNAQVKVDDVVWNGAVEIHVKSSDWLKHKHENDPNFKKTILHVVYENDTNITYRHNELIPCLSLKNRLPVKLLSTYQALKNEGWIPCEKLLAKASELSVVSAKEKALSKRMHGKVAQVADIKSDTVNNLEEMIYRMVLRSFGLKQNAEAFLNIAKYLPLKTLKKNFEHNISVEALLYGSAGMLLKEYKDEYPARLKYEYEFLKNKYHLKPQSLSQVKRKGVRPNSFPEIRLSIFSNTIRQQNFFSNLIQAESKEIVNLFRANASNYWDDHYSFDKLSTKKSNKKLGINSINTIIINAIVPILLFWGERNQDDKQVRKAYEILENLPEEKNATIDKWKGFGVTAKNAFDSQALLGLKKTFCDKKKCLECPIGNNILRNC